MLQFNFKLKVLVLKSVFFILGKVLNLAKDIHARTGSLLSFKYEG